MDDSSRLLVLGLGNVLLRDDGLGVQAVERLQTAYVIPDEVHAVDGGTLGLALLDEVVHARAAILVDAVKADEPAGTIVRITGDDVAPAVALRLSPHQVGVADLLAAARFLGRLPETIVLLGIVPESIELGLGCTPPVERQLGQLVACVAEECAALGHPLAEAAP